jgi:SAM-dependent methyltransferase
MYNTAKFHFVVSKAKANNETFVREHPGFSVPSLELCYDAYGHVSYPDYFASGKKHAAFFAGLMNEHGLRDAAVLEWGCGPARVIRHLGASLAGSPSLAGSDYNAETIAWCRENIPGIRFEKNELAPPLPFAAESFDAVYALSVITHLSAKMHDEWREELLRVLKPGGLLIVTAHGDWYREHHLLPAERAMYDAGHLVVRGEIEEGKKWFAAFHSPVYMREHFFAGMDIAQHLVHPLPGSIEQDVWIARKKREAI